MMTTLDELPGCESGSRALNHRRAATRAMTLYLSGKLQE
jgi:hypothetical protein